ncbi:MAG: hypothetical protein J5850_01065 [Clostridia bacterium]|nr:hypothetical protein [Clostridia bacterium]
MDNNVMETDYYPEEKKPSSIVGIILKWAAIAIIVLVIGLLFFRIFIKNDPAQAKQFVWTKETVEAYNADKDSFKVYSYELTSYNKPIGVKDENGVQEYERITYNNITTDGTFSFNNLVYVPSSKELQITVRYNRKAVESLKETLMLTEVDKEPFFFALEDLNGNYYSSYYFTSFSRFTYEYRRLVFKDVDLSNVDMLYLNVYYNKNVNLSSPLRFYPGKKYQVTLSMPIYDSYLEFGEYDMKNALPAEENGNLDTSPYVIAN